MPSRTPVLPLKSARELIRERSFVSGTGQRVGVELEWFTHTPLDVEGLRTLVAEVEPLPRGSTITFEPGGQIELSSRPLPSPSDACAAISSDSAVLRAHLAEHGVGLSASGFDAHRSLALRTSAPRYVAMRRFFDRYGEAGGQMMCGSAAIHVNLDAGDDAEGRERFEIANLIGPVLVATFANSPVVGDAPSGWKSTRFAAWWQLDPTRTRPAGGLDAWIDYALDAVVMFVRCGDDYRTTERDMTFREWIETGSEHGYPEPDDLAYHLTTLFPPVRLHGHLELRMVDMLPDPWWRAAVAIASTLVCDAAVRDAVRPACAPTREMWEIAARCGLEDAVLARAAQTCFDIAIDRIDGSLRSTVIEFAERFVRRGRCPADELLDGFLISEAR